MNLRECKNCDIVVFTPRTFSQKAIAYFSGLYSHIGFLLKGNILKALFLKLRCAESACLVDTDKLYLISASLKKGVCWEPLEDVISKYKDAVVYRIKDITSTERSMFLSYFLGSIGKKYSFMQIIRIFLKLMFNIVKKLTLEEECGSLVCCEYVGYMLILIDDYNCRDSLAYSTPDSIINGFSRLQLIGTIDNVKRRTSPVLTAGGKGRS